MSTVSTAQVVETAEALLDELNETETELKQAQLDQDNEIKEVTAKFAPTVDRLTRRRERLVAALTELYVEHREFLTQGTGKTVVFRGGTLSSRLAGASLVIDDESLAMRYIRRMGKLRRFTKLGKRTLDKAALKKDPAFVRRAPGMHMEQDENLTIKLPKAQSEIIRKLHPLRARLGRSA